MANKKKSAELVRKGDAFMESNEPDEALKSYDKALRIDPNAFDALHGKAMVLHNLGRYNDAIAFYDKALDIEPRNQYAWRNKGLVFSNLKKYKEAIKLYDRSIAIDPEYAPVLDDKTAALYALKRYDDALECSDKAIRIDPLRSSSWIRKGDTLFQKKDYHAALKCYETASDINQSDVWAWSSKGSELLSLDPDQALVYFDRAIEKHPGWAWAWEGRALALGKLKRYEEAIAGYDKAINLDPNYAEAWLHKGDLLFESAKYDAAIEQYRQLTEIDADYLWIWSSKGNALIELAEYQKAIEFYDEAIKQDRENFEAWGNRGFCYDKLENVDEARNSYDEAITLKPDYSWALVNQGNLFFGAEQYDEAIRFYDKALKSSPEEVWASYNKALALAKLGKEKASQDQYRKALEHAEAITTKNSDNSDAWAVKGESLLKLGELDAAEVSFKEAVRINPRNVNALIALCEIYSDYKFDFDEGLKLAQQANGVDDSLSTKSNLAENLLKTHKYDQARTQAFQALAYPRVRQPYACLLRFFVAASFLLDRSNIKNERFDEFLTYYRSINFTFGSADWTSNGLICAIQNTEVSPHTKFLLLTMIDVMQGRIDMQTLSFFRKPQTTANPHAITESSL